MKPIKSLALSSLLFLTGTCFSQTGRIIDSQLLPSGKFISLVQATPEADGQFQLVIVDRHSRDTTIRPIDSVNHAPASYPNAIFFVNDSVGFFTETGGCYASYNWLFRTSDGGLTWTFIETGSRTDGNSFDMLNNQSFYMFNETQGIIVWEIKEGNLVYSITSDGGLTWTMKSQAVVKSSSPLEIQSILFSAEGQITVAFSEQYVFESNRKNSTLVQSNNFGQSFKKLN